MKCSKCGTELNDNVKFCHECGTKINNDEPKSELSEYVIDSTKKIKNDNSNSSNTWHPAILGIAPLMWILWKYPQVNAESKMLQIAEASAGAVIILILSLIIPTIIYLVKKAKHIPYNNFVKHVFIGAIIMLGLLYLSEKNSEQENVYNESIDSNKFITANFYKIACYLGSEKKCGLLGLMYEEEKNYTKSIMYYKKACEINRDENACKFYALFSGTVGMNYYTGNKEEAIEQDYTKAAIYLDKSCDAGNILACYFLGKIYYHGFLGIKDYTKARKFYEKGCGGGMADSCMYLGLLYDSGEEVMQDYTKAAMYYEKACAGDSIEACLFLGSMYDEGNGVQRDYTKASNLYEKACNGGVGAGCHMLAYMYLKGKGIEQNNYTAQIYYDKACSLSDDKSKCIKLPPSYFR